MADELTMQDKLDLERRRMTEAISASVEADLRKRYSWIGIVLAVAAFIGGATVIRGLTKDLEIQIALGQTQLKEIAQRSSEADQLSSEARKKLLQMNQEITAQLTDLTATISDKAGELDELFKAKQVTVDNLTQTSRQLEAISKRLDDLTTVVATLATSSAESRSEVVEAEVGKSIEGLKKQQIELAQSVAATSDQILLSQYSIYVHYLEGSAESRNLGNYLAEDLAKSGFVVPDVRGVVQKSRSVRYFYEEDLKVATRVQEIAHEFLAKRGFVDSDLKISNFTDYSGKKPRRGVIELWFY